MFAFWRRSPPFALPTAAEHASAMRLLDERLRWAADFGREMALWPPPLDVIRAACGIGPAVEYPVSAKPASLTINDAFRLSMEEAAAAMDAIVKSGRSFSLRQMEARYVSGAAKAAFDRLLTAKEDELIAQRATRMGDADELKRIWESGQSTSLPVAKRMSTEEVARALYAAFAVPEGRPKVRTGHCAVCQRRLQAGRFKVLRQDLYGRNTAICLACEALHGDPEIM